MGYLTRGQILGADDIERAEVPVPEWGGTVLVRGLTGAERDQFEESLIRYRAGKRKLKVGASLINVRARLVSLCAIDEEGNRLFSDADVATLGQKSAAGLVRVYDVAARLSGLEDRDIEVLTQDFDKGPNGGSGSN